MLFETPTTSDQEAEVIARIEELRRALRYQVSEPRRWSGALRRTLFARAIQQSNSIEGYNVTLDDAIAATEGEEPMKADPVTWGAISGYRRAMTYVLTLTADQHFAYSPTLVRSLHYMMMESELDKGPGIYRPGSTYIRNSSSGEIVYEGPDGERVPALVEELVEGLNANDPTHPLVRAAMAHLNLVLIHPFKDGNGRMARCLQTLVLAREGTLAPEFSSIEEYLGRNTSDYYRVLAEVGRGYWQPENDARPWVRFCLVAHYRQATTILRRVKETERLWQLLTDAVEQRGLPERCLYALHDAAKGYRVRRATYQPIAEVSENLASRDLKSMVDAGFLIPRGERRGRFYVASEDLRALRSKSLEVRVPIEDPFASAKRTSRR